MNRSHIVINNVPTNNSLLANIPPVPPTPGPRSVDTIQTDAKDRFVGMIWIQKDPSKTVDDYFIEYDYWEKYSETKSYSKRSYIAAYKGLMKEYSNYLCILNSDQGDEFYVVAKRVRSELEALEPFCTCSRCVASVINPIKYLWCPHCTSCIKAGPGFAKQEYIDKAKILKQENDKKIPKKYLNNMSLVKISEIIGLSVVTIAIIAAYI